MMDERNEYVRTVMDAAEEVAHQRDDIEKNVDVYKNSLIEYIGQQDIVGELQKIKSEQQEIEERVRREEEMKQESWLYRLFSKLKKTL